MRVTFCLIIVSNMHYKHIYTYHILIYAILIQEKYPCIRVHIYIYILASICTYIYISLPLSFFSFLLYFLSFPVYDTPQFTTFCILYTFPALSYYSCSDRACPGIINRFIFLSLSTFYPFFSSLSLRCFFSPLFASGDPPGGLRVRWLRYWRKKMYPADYDDGTPSRMRSEDASGLRAR